MITAAETLGRDWDFVRADFYDTGDRLFFGELTMTPGGGRDRFRPEEFDRYLGGLWKIRTQYRFRWISLLLVADERSGSCGCGDSLCNPRWCRCDRASPGDRRKHSAEVTG
jgi:hypothetical protein